MKEEDCSVISNDFHTACRVVYLTRAFIQKKLSAGEREELDAWLEASDENLGTLTLTCVSSASNNTFVGGSLFSSNKKIPVS